MMKNKKIITSLVITFMLFCGINNVKAGDIANCYYKIYSKYLNPNVKYFIYCQKGLTSKKACQILSNYGYKVVDIIGGYEEWIMQQD